MNNFNKGALYSIVESLFKMSTQLIMIVLLSRYLGPGKLGVFFYCIAIVAVFGFLNALGMDNILIKKFIRYESKKNSYLKHALLLRFISGFLCIATINLLGLLLLDQSYRLLLFVLSLHHIALPYKVYALFFQAQGRADLASIGSIFGLSFGFMYRLLCLYLDLSLVFLGFAYVIEALIVGYVYRCFFKEYKNKTKELKLSVGRAKKLFYESVPLMFAGAVTLVYMKIDQIMLGRMTDEVTVGVYVSAARLTEACWFIGLAIVGVYFPKILLVKETHGDVAYYNGIIKHGRWVVWSGIVLACMTVIWGEVLIDFLYGDDFLRSVDVFIVTILTVPFVYLGAISTKMFVVDGATSIVLIRSIFGLLMNVVLNFFLIPYYQELGAAIALLLSYICVCYLFNSMAKNKNVFKTQTRVVLGLTKK